MAARFGLAVWAAAWTAISAYGQLLSPQSMYGINTHIPTDPAVARLQAAGVAWARIDINWPDVQPTGPSQYNWTAIDAVVASANARSIRLFATLAYTPAWANGGQPRNVPPADVNDWKRFVRAAVGRYKASIRHWGLWNEPDLDQFFSGTTSQYINTILIPGAQAVREADPGALRCGPELAGDSNFLRDVLNAAKDHVDVVTLHKYDERVSEIMRKWDGFRWFWEDPNYRTVLESTGAWGKAVWFTEVGWPTADGTHVDTVTPQQQANLYVELLDAVRQRPWIQKIFFYELRDDPTPGVPKWGILNADLTEKPAYAAYRDYIQAHPPPATVTVTDLRRYSLADLAVGSLCYLDRDWTITSMPPYLHGRRGIRTADADRDATTEAWIDFDVDADADVYIAYDPRAASLPAWMSGYAALSDTIGLSDPAQGYARLYRRTVRVGEVVLGANRAAGASGALRNYFVLVLPAGSGPPARATLVAPPHGATQVRADVDLVWTAGAGAASHNVHFGTADPPPFRANQIGTTYAPGRLAGGTTYYWRVDEVNAAGVTTGETWSFTTAATGDFDGDGDVDLTDFSLFQVCYGGPNRAASGWCVQADVDRDQDVDLVDFALFQACFNGPNRPPACMG